MFKSKIIGTNTTTLLLFAIILSDLVEHMQSDNTPNPFTRQFFVPSNQRAHEMKHRFNVQNDQHPFRTITMNGGQQFVLVPRRIFFQNRHLFSNRRLLPSSIKFRIRQRTGPSSKSKFKHMPMLSTMPKALSPFWMAKSNPKQHALPIAVSTPNAKKMHQSSSSNSFTVSAVGSKSAFVPRLTNAGAQNSVAPFSPRAPIVPLQKVSLLRPPLKLSKIRPPTRVVSQNIGSNLAEMPRKRDDFFKKQRKEFQMMRERIERRRMEMERQQRILDEEERNRERLRILARERTQPMAPTFGGMHRPQHLQPMPPISTTTSRPISPPLALSPAAVAPPGQLPPNDQVIDQLNNALDFMDVANRLRLKEQFRRRKKVHANA